MARRANAAASDRDFKQFAQSLGSISGLEAWVRSHFIYRDENEEILRTPEFMLSDMGRLEDGRVVGLEGDCYDISAFIAAAAEALGYKARFVAIRYSADNPNFEHVFTEVFQGGMWQAFDPTIAPGATLEWIEEMIQEV